MGIMDGTMANNDGTTSADRYNQLMSKLTDGSISDAEREELGNMQRDMSGDKAL